MNRTPAVQEMGSVKFPDSRLVAYPHGIQHRMGPVELVGKSVPGHLDVLKLWMVDPNCRVCSTRKVPPQRHDWWMDAVLKPQQSGLDGDGGWKWPRPLPSEIPHRTRPTSLSRWRRRGSGKQKRREHEELC